MTKTLHIDEQILREAKRALHEKTDTEAVTLGLDSLGQARRISEVVEAPRSEPTAADVPRGREGRAMVLVDKRVWIQFLNDRMFESSRLSDL